MKPLVTIAVTTLNRSKYLSESLGCVLKQDYSNLDILISDNGSIDDTPAMINELMKSANKVRFRRNKITLPIHEHFTQCVQEAKGEYFILLHDDDLINSSFVTDAVAVAVRHPDVNVVVPSNGLIDEHGAIIRVLHKPKNEVFDGPQFVCDWLNGTGPQLIADVTTALFRTETIRHFGGYHYLGGGRNIDNLLFLQCAISARIGFAVGAQFFWRVYSSSYGNSATPQQIAESGRDFVNHLRQDKETVQVLQRLPKKFRKRIFRGVGELTAIEVLSKMKNDGYPFSWSVLCDVFKLRHDVLFAYIVLREYLRNAFPGIYYKVRRMIKR